MPRATRKSADKGAAQAFCAQINLDLIDRHDGQEAIEYVTEQTALRNWKPGTVSRLYSCLAGFLKEIKRNGRTLSTLAKKDAVNLIAFLRDHNTWSESTRPDNWDRFRAFYKWAYKKNGKSWDTETYDTMAGEERYKYKVDPNKLEQKDIFTPEEVLELVNAEPNLGYKALWAVGFEGGLRIGEAMALRLRDVQRTPDGSYTISLPKSKTRQRTIPLELYSPAILSKWLSLHPFKGNENASLFINENNESIDYKGVGKRLKILAARAGYSHKIKICFHSLRHSRATELATIMTEQQMCAYFGWASSDMCQVYVRKGAIDLRQAIRRGYGIEQAEEKREYGRKCLNCSHVNAQSAEYCDNCHLPLDAKKLTSIKDSLRMQAVLKEYVREEFKDVIEKLKQEYEGERGERNGHSSSR